MQQFLTDTFYQSPVLLEPEPDNTFLGCDINPDQQTISYIQPANTWQFQLYTSNNTNFQQRTAAFVWQQDTAIHIIKQSVTLSP